MAVFGTEYNYSVTALDIVRGALRDINALETGETPPGSEIEEAMEALNLITKQWMGGPNPIAPGLKMWLTEVYSLTPVAQAKFQWMDSGGDIDESPPTDIFKIMLKHTDSGSETELKRLTREEYHSLTSKGETGTPTRWYYERRLDAGDLYFDFLASTTVISDYTLEIYYRQLVEDFDSTSSTPDFPQEYYRPLKYQLALDLYPEYWGPTAPVPTNLVALKSDALILANSFHPEMTTEHYQVDGD